MIRVSDGHVVDEEPVLVAVSPADVNAGVEGVGGHDAGHGGEVFQHVLFPEYRGNAFNSFYRRKHPAASGEGGHDDFFQVVSLVPENDDERYIAFGEFVSLFFVVDVGEFQRGRNDAFQLKEA